jgi:hypothetical protein
MKKLLSFALICLSLPSVSQNVFFPKSYYTDSVTLTRNMPALARQVMAVYKDANRNTWFDNLFRCQIVAEQYSNAGQSLDSLRDLMKGTDSMASKAIGFQYQTFAYAKLDASKCLVRVPNWITANF